MNAFVSDYLKARGGPDDWVCVEDVCVSHEALTGMALDLTAHWSPSREIVVFGNTWAGVPDMPAETRPLPEEVAKWAREHPNWYERHYAACVERAREWRRSLDETDRFYRERGIGRVEAVYRLPDGREESVSGVAGRRGPIALMRNLRSNLKGKYGAECPIVSLRVYRAVPGRGEHLEK